MCVACGLIATFGYLRWLSSKKENEKRKTKNTVNNFTFNRKDFCAPLFIFFSMSYIDCVFAVVFAVTPAAVPAFAAFLASPCE